MAVHGQDSAGGGMLCYGFWGFLAASKENSAVRDPGTPTNCQRRFFHNLLSYQTAFILTTGKTTWYKMVIVIMQCTYYGLNVVVQGLQGLQASN